MVASTGTPNGLIAMNRVCEPVAIPERFTWRALAPSGTVTKYDVKPFRSTEPSLVYEKVGFLTSFEATTTVDTSKSTTLVAGSSIRTIAPCAPSVAGLAVTLMVTALLSGNATVFGALKVPSLPWSVTSCLMVPAGPLVRVSLTG